MTTNIDRAAKIIADAYLALADALESGDYSPGQTIKRVDQ